MNPLCNIDSKGMYSGIKEPSLEVFKNKIASLNDHFVIKGEWIDPKTGACIPKKTKLLRIIDNIVYYIKYVFGFRPQDQFSNIKSRLCTYVDCNKELISKSFENDISKEKARQYVKDNKDLIIQINNISTVINRKFLRSFLAAQCKAEIMAGGNPIVQMMDHIRATLHFPQDLLPIELFEKLDLKADICQLKS